LGSNGYVLRLSSSSPYTGIDFDGMETANGLLTAGQWYHLAAVNDAGTRHLYINGSEVSLSGTAISVANNTDPLTIGVDYLSSPRYFNGSIDEVRLWNTVRPVDSIQADMKRQLTGSETGLAGLWQFNEGYLTTAYDATSNDNTGVLQKSSWISSTAPLPVEMASFTAVAQRNNVDLHWNTATEVNNFGFNVERQDATNTTWTKIAFVEGSGTSSAPHAYSYIDRGLLPGQYGYRIVQVDRTGGLKYSKEMHVDVGTAPRVFALSQNYPNPFNPTTTIEFTLPSDGRVVLKVYDITGREQATLLDEERKAGVYQQVVFDASRLASGVYFARLQFGGKQLLKKMLLLK
jgi:hypothetical protein